MDFGIAKLRVQSAHESGAAVYDLSAVITAFKSWIAREASLRSKCSRTLGETNVFAGPMPNATIDLAGLSGMIDSAGRFESIFPPIVCDRKGKLKLPRTVTSPFIIRPFQTRGTWLYV